MDDLVAIKVEVNTMAHAFNVNGVAFSRKYLSEIFPAWGDSEETFYRFLVMVPFIAETRDIDDAPGALGRYIVYKAKRIYKALELPRDAVGPFMLASCQMGEFNPENMKDIYDAMHDIICDCGVVKGRQPAHAGRTLH